MIVRKPKRWWNQEFKVCIIHHVKHTRNCKKTRWLTVRTGRQARVYRASIFSLLPTRKPPVTAYVGGFRLSVRWNCRDRGKDKRDTLFSAGTYILTLLTCIHGSLLLNPSTFNNYSDIRGFLQPLQPNFVTHADRPRGPPSSLYNGYRVSFAGVKRLEHGIKQSPYLAPSLKKE